MLNIGNAQQTKKSYADGITYGIGLPPEGVKFSFVENPDKIDKNSNIPDFQIVNEFGYQIGRAWKPKLGKKHCYTVFESPWMPVHKVEASLFPIDDKPGFFSLVWYPPANETAPKVTANAENGARKPASDENKKDSGRKLIKRGQAPAPM